MYLQECHKTNSVNLNTHRFVTPISALDNIENHQTKLTFTGLFVFFSRHHPFGRGHGTADLEHKDYSLNKVSSTKVKSNKYHKKRHLPKPTMHPPYSASPQHTFLFRI